VCGANFSKRRKCVNSFFRANFAAGDTTHSLRPNEIGRWVHYPLTVASAGRGARLNFSRVGRGSERHRDGVSFWSADAWIEDWRLIIEDLGTPEVGRVLEFEHLAQEEGLRIEDFRLKMEDLAQQARCCSGISTFRRRGAYIFVPQDWTSRRVGR
jgi:hypothetical protein